ncbi:hypothetical protein ACF0H5_014310 [Mactra antiquata]
MAEAAPSPVPNVLGDQWETLKKIRRLRELYKGRFTEDQCGVLLRHNDNDLERTLQFMFEEPRQIRHVIGQEDWVTVSSVANELRENVRQNNIKADVRQFGCKECNHRWWRKVPTRKMVSRCKHCKRSYKAIPKGQEYGWARFHCINCNRDFESYGMLDLSILHIGLRGKSQAYCLVCFGIYEPIKIIPPSMRNDRRRRRRYGHCTAYNCFSREPRDGIPVINFCVHPMSLGTNVPGIGSVTHNSTGSTVKTFLTQDDPMCEPYEPTLHAISENEHEDNI